ncbi:MAG: hypothetical protein ABIJ57_10940 [Pseudomonadota bacterium]
MADVTAISGIVLGAISVPALGVLWWQVREGGKKAMDAVEKLESSMYAKMLTKETHQALCDNAQLRLGARIDLLTQSTDSFRGEVTASLGRIETAIKNGVNGQR